MSRSVLAALLLFALVAAGCKSETRVPVDPVSGKLSFQGQPPAGAQVILVPAAGSKLPPDLAASGTVNEDGTFQIDTYAKGDGAPAGEYVATVQWFKLVNTDGGTGKGPNVIPAKYASATTSPIKVTVGKGPTEIPPVDLTN